MLRQDPGVGSLAQLRQEIESVDRSIVLLLAARLAAAQRALGVRVAHHRPVTDEAQELRVLERSLRWARELGVPEALVERLFRTLIEEGKARFRRSDRSPDRFVTVLIAGPDRIGVALQNGPEPQVVPVPALR